MYQAVLYYSKYDDGLARQAVKYVFAELCVSLKEDVDIGEPKVWLIKIAKDYVMNQLEDLKRNNNKREEVSAVAKGKIVVQYC